MVDLYCDINNGVEYGPYRLLRRIMSALCGALQFAVDIGEFLLSTLWIDFTSGASFKLADSGQIFDCSALFPEQKVWAVQVKTVFGYWWKPLRKTGFTTMFDAVFYPSDIKIAGSENWWYNDDGERRLGTSFSPERQYGIFTDGSIDAATIVLIGYILKFLHTIGLEKAASKFFQTLMTWGLSLHARSIIGEVLTEVQSIKDEVKGTDAEGELIDKVDELNAKETRVPFFFHLS